MHEQEGIALENIAKSLFTINKHAKTAPEPKHLYTIKKKALNKLLQEKRAEKIGLHFSNHSKYSKQQSSLLIRVDQYFFHIPPFKEDFNQLKHLGNRNQNYRNPTTKMSLSQAKKTIYAYLGWNPNKNYVQKNTNKLYKSPHFMPSSLGRMTVNSSKKSK